MALSKAQLKYNRTVKGICSRAAGYAKYRSKRKNIKYEIDTKYLISIYPKSGMCPILGYKLEPFQNGKIGQSKFSPSLDRINPRKGYIKGNVEFICGLANNMLNNAEGPDLIRFAAWINTKYGNPEQIAKSKRRKDVLAYIEWKRSIKK